MSLLTTELAYALSLLISAEKPLACMESARESRYYQLLDRAATTSFYNLPFFNVDITISNLSVWRIY